MAGAAADPAAAASRRRPAPVARPVHRGGPAGQRRWPGPLPTDPGAVDGAAGAAPQRGDLPGPGHPHHLRADLRRLPAGRIPLRRAVHPACPRYHHPVPRERLGLRDPAAGRGRPGLAHRADPGGYRRPHAGGLRARRRADRPGGAALPPRRHGRSPGWHHRVCRAAPTGAQRQQRGQLAQRAAAGGERPEPGRGRRAAGAGSLCAAAGRPLRQGRLGRR